LNIAELRQSLDAPAAGRAMYDLVRAIFPMNRSITGDGVRETLAAVDRVLPLDVHEVLSGTPVLDWTVPPEWNLRGAWLRAPDGSTVVDAADSNLHVVSYSEPVHTRLPLAELRDHLHTLPDRPTLIPYRTSYYGRSWGLCLAHNIFESLEDGEYEVCIDTTLADGSLTYGECVIPGELTDEVLISAHVCHPSLANDNCSGIALAAVLGSHLAQASTRYTYRFVFVPGTIGSITWLARNEHVLPRIRHGIVLSGVGDRASVSYKRSRRGDAAIDRAVERVLAASGRPFTIHDFSPYGYDERQYCSPGFNLPVGRLSRSTHGEYPEYHTSGDNLEFVSAYALADSLATILTVFDDLESSRVYLNLSPKGEPQLGKRGLYRAIGGSVDRRAAEMALLWVLNLSDGTQTLRDIAERSGLSYDAVQEAADALVAAGLLAPAESAQ
jgi:aminopeptidase-like protein